MTVLVSENGCGKSSTTNAIEWCLFGGAVTKKSCGIDERADWEVRPRSASGEPTVVRVVFASDQGRIEMERRRSASAKPRDHDELSVHCADGTVLQGPDAEGWMRNAGLPDWETYRRAHCFHQEAARRRILDQEDRSAILASLLGLDEDLRLIDMIAEQNPGGLIKTIDDLLDKLAHDIEANINRPLREMSTIERRLADKGVGRASIGIETALDLRRRLLARAVTLAGKLALRVQWPDESDGPAVLAWARRWSETARQEAPALSTLPDLRKQFGVLSAAIPRVSGLVDACVAAATSLRAEVLNGGDLAEREAALTAAKESVKSAKDRRDATNRRFALLTDACKVIDAAHDTDSCPVCDSRIPGLRDRLAATCAAIGSESLAVMEADVSNAEQAQRDAQEQLDSLFRLDRELQSATAVSNNARTQLAIMLGEVPTEVHDVVAFAKKTVERLEGQIKELDALLHERDSDLSTHEDMWPVLADVERWLTESQHAADRVELHKLPAWAELNQAIDAVAGFAADLEALADLAREAQEERSAAREAEVNERLGKYYALVTGETTVGSIRVKTKRTPQKVSYQLIDAKNREAVPVLNQAAANALSLSLLFAQAAAQAEKGRLAWVVLDDPVQSLDDERQAGLARALEDLSRSCSVLTAVVPGPFTERLKSFVSVKRRFVGLQSWDVASGARLGAVEER